MKTENMEDLLLHPVTRQNTVNFLRKPSHALLIVGQTGAGKYKLARAIASDLLGIDVAKLSDYPYLTELRAPDGKTEISIESVREVIASLKLKAPQSKSISRVIIIQGAERASQEAQNALLKILEEPPAGSLFLLTANSARGVLPTISSRTRVITAHQVSLELGSEYYSKEYSKQRITSAWGLSGGATGLLDALLTNDQGHPLKSAVSDAKQLILGDTFYRLLTLDELGKNKSQFGLVIEALTRVVESLHHQTGGSAKKQSSMLKNRQLLAHSRELLAGNTNTRLIALNLALNLAS